MGSQGIKRKAKKPITALKAVDMEARKEKLVFKFSDKEAFGSFCETLLTDHVPFSLAGNQTVIVNKARLEELPAMSRMMFDKYSHVKLIELLPTAQTDKKRRLPTTEEAKALFREFAKSRA